MILNGIYFLDSIIPRWWKKSDNNFGPQSSWYNLMPDQKWKWSCIRKINFSVTLEQLKCPTVAKDENWRAKKANLFKEAFRPSFKSLARSFCSLGHWGVYFENENREICKKRYSSDTKAICILLGFIFHSIGMLHLHTLVRIAEKSKWIYQNKMNESHKWQQKNTKFWWTSA